jgi:hypothetical protein
MNVAGGGVTGEASLLLPSCFEPPEERREGHPTVLYTGELINQLIETVDRVFRRMQLPLVS